MIDFKDKTVAILGFGVEGISTTRFVVTRGAMVTIFDQKEEKDLDQEAVVEAKKLGATFTLGKDSFEKLLGMDVIVRSPGLKRSLPILQAAEKKGVIITSHTQLFFDYCSSPIIGVTGTKGKGTTATLIYHMLHEEGLEVYLGGNIGTPPLDFVAQLQPHSWVVLELSSFQLQDLTKSPHIGVMLMTTSEHLDYHKDVYEYIAAKRNMFAHQSEKDFAVLNKDYPASRESDVATQGAVYWVSKEDIVLQGAYIRQGSMYLNMGPELKDEEEIIPLKDIKIPGEHNWENALAAVVAARLAGVGKKVMAKVLKEFAGLEHRIEKVAEVKGVTYYDDSFSTTPETSIAAIHAFGNPKILILGGSSKNSDFSELGRIIRETDSIKAIIGIGTEWQKIKEAIGTPKALLIEGAKDMQHIVAAAAKIATPGDVVLLSPACASFDMFKNYKERGNKFQEAVKQLQG